MDEEPIFAVELKRFEPHTVRSGRGHRDVKSQLREAIVGAAGAEAVEAARVRAREERLRIDVEFRLWKGGDGVTETRAKKDLDNLLKPVMDALQTSTDAQKTSPGLGLIETDDSVFEIVARKRIVDDVEDEGLRIRIERMPEEGAGTLERMDRAGGEPAVGQAGRDGGP